PVFGLPPWKKLNYRRRDCNHLIPPEAGWNAAVSGHSEVCYPRSEAREGPAVKRRKFIALLGGAAAWASSARAQRPMLRVGTVAGTPKSSPQWVAFERRMGELGYKEFLL